MKNYSVIAASIVAAFTVGTSAQAQTAGNLIGAPLTSGGSVLYGAAAAHAGIAPTVNHVSPSAEPLTDGVTNAIAATGAGVSTTGGRIQGDGLLVGTQSNGQPVVSVGATNPANQGSLAAVANGRRP